MQYEVLKDLKEALEATEREFGEWTYSDTSTARSDVQ